MIVGRDTFYKVPDRTFFPIYILSQPELLNRLEQIILFPLNLEIMVPFEVIS